MTTSTYLPARPAHSPESSLACAAPVRLSTSQGLLRAALATAALVALSACGGGESTGTTAAATSAASTTADAATATAVDAVSTTSTGTTPTETAAALPPPAGAGRTVPSPLYGVTVDDVSGLSSITEALSKLSRTPTTRIVFDEYQPASGYRKATVAINKVSYVMGEILDSQYLTTVNVQGYLDRTNEYLSTLGDVVDIWEIGNEINGEWLGTNSDVVAKMTGAYDIVKGQGRTTALTLYYNQDCWSKKSNEMFTWAAANIPQRMKQGLDYVLVSYYEEDCNNLKPDWNAVFTQLSAMFPNSRLGFGEVGTSSASQKAAYLQRYYALKPPVTNYVGGYFWWYFREDMVPYTKALWSTLNEAIAATN